jgi:hypothetical protein
MMVVKRTSATEDWTVWHKDLTGTSPFISLNSTGGASTAEAIWTSTEPTSTAFTVGSHGRVNTSGQTYVAYLWADNSSEDAEEQMIKCDSYTTSSSGDSGDVDLGWEPQFVLFKNAGGANNWVMLDSMRGFHVAGVTDAYLFPNSNEAEGNANFGHLTSTGFRIINQSNSVQYIYMAIRAPMMKEPEAATDVFATVVGRSSNSGGKGNFLSGFPVDFGIGVSPTGGGSRYASSRLTGKEHMDPATQAAGANNAAVLFDYSDGWGSNGFSGYHSWMWKRAKGFFDVVCYSGNATAGRTLPHSLSVAPELLIVRRRNDTEDWTVWPSAGNFLNLNSSVAMNVASTNIWNLTDPTSTVFSVGTSSRVNTSGHTYIAYLFATLAGISKVGSYTGNGSSQTISCGFSAGSRFILIKRTDEFSDWYVWDTTRGIVAGNDPHLSLNTTVAQVTTDDSVDPHNSGFIVNQNSVTDINVSSGTYIFYAIA